MTCANPSQSFSSRCRGNSAKDRCQPWMMDDDQLCEVPTRHCGTPKMGYCQPREKCHRRSRDMGKQCRSAPSCQPPAVTCSGQDDTQMETVKLYGVLQNLAEESQKELKNEVEDLRLQLQAQQKVVECLNQSVTMLQQESCQQLRKIQRLEEEVKRIGGPQQEDKLECLMDQKIQDVWRSMAKEVSHLQEYIKQRADIELCNRNEAVENLAQEIQESKKFLWEELESLRADLEQVQVKLGCQENEILNHQMDIEKIKDIQANCRKVLRQLVGNSADSDCCQEQGRCPNSSRQMDKELENIWSAMSSLQNDMQNMNMSNSECARGNQGCR
ncbi:coiled-coil domain-containing protein 159-like isoform X2 [Ambystoma mexicanum]|uniref:coiled-coil domain-containing protein 159-like isoform X2 n=2 Tax=Ambystoma mexicanum TaxID=8296 RepID=UPI0037E994D0